VNVRVACAQYAIREGDRDHNLGRSLYFIRRAAEQGADLVVLPELATSGCDLGSYARALELGEEFPGGSTVLAWKKQSEDSGVCVVGGLLEREGDTVYNCAVLLAPGVAGRYRKTHLWNKEKFLYEPGRELPVFDTPLGRIGVLICYDAWFPEAARTLALKGAQVLCIPSNAPDDWVQEDQRRGGLTMLNVHTIAHANANRLFVAVANRVGDGYLGRSCVVDPTGGVLALGDSVQEELLLADVDPGRAHSEKQLTEASHALDDRNPEIYQSWTEG
jgi:predicted amidohydrolase